MPDNQKEVHRLTTVSFRLSSSVFRLPSVVITLIVLYAVTLSWLSLSRDAAHLTNALDLGYYSNTLWNTLHGAPFRFTTYHAANFVFTEFDPKVVRKPDDLLAFHVEPILLPLSLLYAVWADPRVLLILQSLVLASGAWPAYQIARRRLAPHALPSLVFPLLYLLSPSLIAANLSDFHPVTLSAAFGLWAFDALDQRAYPPYFVWVVLLLALKEEMGLLVALLGAYAVTTSVFTGRMGVLANAPTRWVSRAVGRLRAWLALPQVRVGLATIVLAGAWTVVAILLERDAAGRQLSLFAARYHWLGKTPRAMLTTALTTTALFDWLQQPAIIGYFGFLLAQSGFAAIFAPELLVIAAPEVAINAFSSFDWQYSGLAHYSAPIVPWLVVAAIVGTARLGDFRFQISDFRLNKGAVVRIGASIVLLSAGYQAYRAGQLPFTDGFTPYVATAHDARLADVVAQIPAGTKVSAQSDLYPHVPERADLYLFPTIADADYLLVDVTGQTYPIQPGEYVDTIHHILDYSPAGIVAAEDGYLLLLGRNSGNQFTLPDSFFSFARADANAAQHPVSISVGDNLQLLGYDFKLDTAATGRLARRDRPHLDWRALHPIAEPLRFVYRFYAADGSLSYAQYDSPTERWLPTTQWQSRQVYVIEQSAVGTPPGGKIGMRVESGDPAAPVIEQPAAPRDALIEDGVIRLLVAR